MATGHLHLEMIGIPLLTMIDIMIINHPMIEGPHLTTMDHHLMAIDHHPHQMAGVMGIDHHPHQMVGVPLHTMIEFMIIYLLEDLLHLIIMVHPQMLGAPLLTNMTNLTIIHLAIEEHRRLTITDHRLMAVTHHLHQMEIIYHLTLMTNHNLMIKYLLITCLTSQHIKQIVLHTTK